MQEDVLTPELVTQRLNQAVGRVDPGALDQLLQWLATLREDAARPRAASAWAARLETAVEQLFQAKPADPDAQDDVLIDANEVHLPTDRSVKVMTRSHDVLHDFFVPQFRARMNIVPGQVSWFWFTPTRAGRFESLCAQLCGVGHPAMRGVVVVEDAAAWSAWLQQQPTFAAMRAKADSVAGAGQQDHKADRDEDFGETAEELERFILGRQGCALACAIIGERQDRSCLSLAENSGSNGGAVYSLGSRELTVIDSRFEDNAAIGSGELPSGPSIRVVTPWRT